MTEQEVLAEVLDPVAFRKAHPRPRMREYAERRHAAYLSADRAITAGYRRVTNDPVTVERIAKALHQDYRRRTPGADSPEWDQLEDWHRQGFREDALAAIEAMQQLDNEPAAAP